MVRAGYAADGSGAPRTRVVSVTRPATRPTPGLCAVVATTVAADIRTAGQKARRIVRNSLYDVRSVERQRYAQRILERGDRDELHVLLQLGGKLDEIRLVARGEDELFDPVASRCQRLLADPSDGQDETAQRDF